jgi:hypothetical protein
MYVCITVHTYIPMYPIMAPQAMPPRTAFFETIVYFVGFQHNDLGT